MVYGYARVSTRKQILQRQIDNIIAYRSDAVIYSDSFTGATLNRPQWNKLYKRLTNGDVVIFDSVSRLSRNADEGIEIYMNLFDRGVELIFLNEPVINTSVYKNEISIEIQRTGEDVDILIEAIEKYLKATAKKQIRIAFEQAEKEVLDLRKRTSEGMKAKNAGKKISKTRTGKRYETPKSKIVKAVIQKHCKEFGGNLKDTECIKLSGCTVGTFYRYKKELLQKYQDDGNIIGQMTFE